MRALSLVLCLLPSWAWAALSPPPSGSGFDLPEPLRSIAQWAFAFQRTLNAEMRQHLAAMKETGAVEPALALMLAAFLYGVFHAIGPGHGKVVIGAWFASRRARIGYGLAACALSALVQAGSAIAAVLLLAGALSLAPRDVMAHAAWLEVASYGLITAMGLFMLVQALRGKHGCGHDHEHHEHGPQCAHHHHHEQDRGLWAMAAAVGFRPCSGAILVLLFTLASGLLWVGILATLAMAVGVALTVSGIGLSALGLNRLLERLFGASARSDRWRRVLGIVGALTITLLGASLLAGVWINGPALTG
ncbi:putative high-affinity nickel-transporter [Magnetospirillum sp. LM-5]|uniref:nickel/cobalt transporter n=1 Tax=Magnetospirillum sp. LM-5 TaxID=2681466 RepID=UPI00137E4ED0|nr:ABC transporter [Magnetospirillum sp. LM-5]CAA7611739.1 putative high-affinity nickel-transporter [Magnetospirillum sp. LM-5]